MIPDKNPYNNWNGNGSTTTFDFDFYIEDETQLAVYHTNSKGVQTLLKYGTDYSINELQNENGSFINFPLASSAYSVLSENEVISLCLILPITQENPYSKSSYLNFETLEYSLDYLTRICQIISRQIERCVKTQEGSSQTAKELVQALNDAQVNAAASASEAATSASEANASADLASTKAETAVKQAEKIKETYIKAMSDISTSKTEAINSIEASLSTAENEILAGRNSIETDLASAIEAVDTKKTEAVNKIKQTGFFMENDNLYYIDSKGETKEFKTENYLPLLTPLWTDHLLEDISYLKADNFSWQDGTAYNAVYNLLESEYDDPATTTKILFDSPNFSISGNPTITDGVISNFSSSNYISLPETFDPQNYTWEKFYKFTTGTNVTITQIIDRASSRSQYGMAILITNGALKTFLSSTGTSWNIADNIQLTGSILANTTYYLKITFDGAKYEYSISTNNTDFTVIGTFTNTATISSYDMRIGISSDNSSPFLGSIDLKECYIKINNTIWWKPYQFTYKATPKGFKIANETQEQVIQDLYNSTGVAWYYLLDKTNTRFKLPRTKYNFVGLRDNIGDYVPESLPSISVTTTSSGNNNVLYHLIEANTLAKGDVGSNKSNVNIGSGTYQNGAPVQQRATQMYLYFYVGDYTQTAIEQTAGLNAELFNNKLDRDHGNDTKPYLKATYTNGTSGYRIWSDGYCEQWGRITATANGQKTITFAKTFKDTNYVAFKNIGINSSQSTAGSNELCCYNFTTTTMQTVANTNHLYSCWKASGYLAEGEY